MGSDDLDRYQRPEITPAQRSPSPNRSRAPVSMRRGLARKEPRGSSPSEYTSRRREPAPGRLASICGNARHIRQTLYASHLPNAPLKISVPGNSATHCDTYSDGTAFRPAISGAELPAVSRIPRNISCTTRLASNVNTTTPATRINRGHRRAFVFRQAIQIAATESVATRALSNPAA